jgi:DnaJ-domain-containing protein 1
VVYTVTAVERALGIPHATFDRNYRHLIDTFRQRAQQQAAAARPAGPVSAGNDPDQVMWRLRRENEDLRRLVKIYAESIRQLTLDHLELEAKLNAAASVATLSSRSNR